MEKVMLEMSLMTSKIGWYVLLNEETKVKNGRFVLLYHSETRKIKEKISFHPYLLTFLHKNVKRIKD